MRLLVIVLVLLALFVLLLWWRQERIVFQPPGPPWPQPGETRRVEYVATDGQPLFGYVVMPTGVPDSAGGGPHGVVIVFHGNGDLAGWQIPWAEEVARRTGWALFLAEYRGYAGLPGDPTYLRSQLDARAAWTAVRDSLGVPAARVALFGHSLGSAVATELAAWVVEQEGAVGSPPAALILQSPFTSAAAMARLQLVGPLGTLWRLIGRVHYDTEGRVGILPVPVWVIHGTRDLIIPVRMGRAVHAAARQPGELLLLEGAGHNDVPLVGGARYWHFLERALQAARAAADAGGSAGTSVPPPG